MYVIQFKGLGGWKLYYKGYKRIRDFPETSDSGGWTIHRTIYLADAMFFADTLEAEEEIEVWCWPEEHFRVEYITEDQLAEAERFKFREQLAGNYIKSKG